MHGYGCVPRMLLHHATQLVLTKRASWRSKGAEGASRGITYGHSSAALTVFDLFY